MTKQNAIDANILIAASETRLKRHLMTKYEKEEVDIIYGGNGFPDWLLLRDGKLLCFELKRNKGSHAKLSDPQRKTIEELLKSNDVKMFLVSYDYSGKIEAHGVSGRDEFIERHPDDFKRIIENIKLSKPIELTLENLKDCDNFNFYFSS